jgi:hypothetical protein
MDDWGCDENLDILNPNPDKKYLAPKEDRFSNHVFERWEYEVHASL